MKVALVYRIEFYDIYITVAWFLYKNTNSCTLYNYRRANSLQINIIHAHGIHNSKIYRTFRKDQYQTNETALIAETNLRLFCIISRPDSLSFFFINENDPHLRVNIYTMQKLHKHTATLSSHTMLRRYCASVFVPR